jgi:ribosome-binding factor A
MSSRKDRRRPAAVADDGIDPSLFFEPRNDARAERKIQQLCKEVERTLSYALGGCNDEALRQLVITGVEPAPDASRLLVTLCLTSAIFNLDVDELMERLKRTRGFLRAEIAAALQRKRTPELAFRLVPPGEAP